MVHVKKGKIANRKHKTILKEAKSYRSRSNNNFRLALQRVDKASQYRFISRKLKKRDFRQLYIKQINAACREYNLPYSHFINKLVQLNIKLNRKMLANLAINEPLTFKVLVEHCKNN